MKVILLGNANVGKTSIINKYVKGVFYDKPTATVGIDFAYKQISKDELTKIAGNANTTSTSSEMQGVFKSSEHKDSVCGGL